MTDIQVHLYSLSTICITHITSGTCLHHIWT